MTDKDHRCEAVVERLSKWVDDIIDGSSYLTPAEFLKTFQPGDDLGNGLVAMPKVPTDIMLQRGDEESHVEWDEAAPDDAGAKMIADIYAAMTQAAKDQPHDP